VPRLIQLSPGGLLYLNVAEHRLKMTPELDGQLKRPLMIVASVEKLVIGDRRLKVLKITTEVGISYGSILNILHAHLGLSKVRARCIPCFLTPVQKSLRVETCSELLAIYSATLDNGLSQIKLVMKRGFTTGIQTLNRSRRSGNTSIILNPGSSSLNFG